MYYVVYRISAKNPLSEIFNSYDDAHKRAKELAITNDKYDYITLCKVDNNNKEQLIRILASY